MAYVVVFLTVLLGMAAAVLDVGSWYRAHRDAQATADASALAGAQALPANPGTAQGLAINYADKNGGGVTPPNVVITNSKGPNDTVRVKVERTSPGIFAQLFGIDKVDIRANATARSYGPSQAKYVAPIVVKYDHPMLNDCGGPCFGPSYQTTIPLDKTGAPGSFDLITFDSNVNGTTGASTIASWIQNGYDQYLPLRQYFSDPGTKWNNSSIQGALNARKGTELLFPIFDTLQLQGSNAEYRIIGWVGFHLTDKGVAANGASGSISGYFTKVIWQGLEATSGGPPPDYGVRSISLVD